MLLGDDFVADRQPEPGAFAGRLRGEERLEELVPDLVGNADAVVAHPHLDGLAEIACGHCEHRSEVPVVCRPLALVRGVESVAEQVEKHSRDVLRHEFDRRDVRAVLPIQSDVEVLILGAGAVIGEIERLLDQRVEVDALPVASAAAGMRQHALDDIVGAFAVFDDPFEIAGQHPSDLVDLVALTLVERREGRRGRPLQFVKQPDRKARKIVDEIERVLDLVGDAGSQLAERRHLFSLNQIGLGRLQVVQRRLGGIARGADLRLGSLSFAFEPVPLDQAVAQHAERSRHRPDLIDARGRHRDVRVRRA